MSGFRRWIFIGALGSVIHPGLQGSLSAADDRPNIVVILTDDMGYADVGIQGAIADVRTPHLDELARGGVRCTAGYVSAPQCSPSRAGILTGVYQQRFGIDSNSEMPLPGEAVTLAERLRPAGYACGMVGKWHLDPNRNSVHWAQQQGLNVAGTTPVKLPEHLLEPYQPAAQGFDQFFNGHLRRYHANFDLQGRTLAPEGKVLIDPRFRIDVQTEAAEAFIRRNHEHPFFLYVGYFAPHVPLEAPQPYLDRFPEYQAVRRRYALAMISAIDDGVGKIQAALRTHQIGEKTLVVFLSDNGAPLHGKQDEPIEDSTGLWDGSENLPWIGEKGMLSEGGIRVPFIWSWPGTLPAGRVEQRPVSSLDIAATAIALAKLPSAPELDGVNLISYLTGENTGEPHEHLYWRFFTQSAIRSGKWKYIQVGTAAEYLFDLSEDHAEQANRIAEAPHVAADLKRRLQEWSETLLPPGLPTTPPRPVEQEWYRQYFGLPERIQQRQQLPQ
ncbi:sulfatase family protein [Planctomicrobium sp. SH664]|uniref:sulfatase family protein n=1 Tax=Planctomicrobium sp. SH664 TaxID=3448125 RepID=UPI003F5AE38A